MKEMLSEETLIEKMNSNKSIFGKFFSVFILSFDCSQLPRYYYRVDRPLFDSK